MGEKKNKSGEPDSCEMHYIYIYIYIYTYIPVLSFLRFRAQKEMGNRDTPSQHHLPMQRCLVILQ